MTAETSQAAVSGAPAAAQGLRIGETGRQAGMLFSAQTAAMVVGLAISILQARFLPPSEMGRLAFCMTFVVIAGVVFEFGFSSAGARVLALARDERNERQALGAMVLLTLAISGVFAVFVAAAAFPLERVFHKEVGWLLVSTAGLAFFQPFQFFIEQGCQGLNQIRRLSLFQLSLSVAYLTVLIVLAASRHLTAGTALAAYFGSMGAAAIWTLFRMRPIFSGTAPYIRLTIRETRRFGLNIYLSRIAGQASTRVDQLVIAYFIADPAPLGIYAIIQKFANPILIIGRSLAATRFRVFARVTAVPSRVKRWNAAMLIIAAAGLIGVGPIAIKLLFPQYAAGVTLVVPFAFAGLFIGLFQPYNIFLQSHGRGAELRNIVLIASVASVVGLTLSVPRFGLAGAAWTGAAVMALDYILHVYYYRVFRRAVSEEPGDHEPQTSGPDIAATR